MNYATMANDILTMHILSGIGTIIVVLLVVVLSGGRLIYWMLDQEYVRPYRTPREDIRETNRIVDEFIRREAERERQKHPRRRRRVCMADKWGINYISNDYEEYFNAKDKRERSDRAKLRALRREQSKSGEVHGQRLHNSPGAGDCGCGPADESDPAALP